LGRQRKPSLCSLKRTKRTPDSTARRALLLLEERAVWFRLAATTVTKVAPKTAANTINKTAINNAWPRRRDEWCEERRATEAQETCRIKIIVDLVAAKTDEKRASHFRKCRGAFQGAWLVYRVLD